jgi:hypothetical protein
MRRLYWAPEFASQLGDLEQHVPQIRESLRGLMLRLRTDPEFGEKISENPPRWFVPMPDVIKRPLGIVYTFDDDRVVLLSIWIS